MLLQKLHAAAETPCCCRGCKLLQKLHFAVTAACCCRSCMLLQNLHVDATTACCCRNCMPLQKLPAAAENACCCRNCMLLQKLYAAVEPACCCRNYILWPHLPIGKRKKKTDSSAFQKVASIRGFGTKIAPACVTENRHRVRKIGTISKILPVERLNRKMLTP